MIEMAIIKDIIQEAKNVRRFIIEDPLKDKLIYESGQLVNIYLDSGSSDEHIRSYSVASAPDNTNQFEIIVTDQPGGKMSDFLFNQAKIGSEIHYKGPMGMFTLPKVIDRDLYLVCTGSGISPFRSMVKYLTENKVSTKKIHLIFGCRTKEDLLYFDELKALEQSNPNFTFSCCLSREEVDGFTHGYVHKVYMPVVESSENKPLFYLCGWRNMITDAKDNLSKLGYKMVKDIKIEVYN
tara:strand:+ start:1977 stop:2690 length:714 start_codon:yes stop_codon:yes gene_type:complete